MVCKDLHATAKRNVLKKLSLIPSRLDALYKQIMQQIIKLDDAEICKQVLATVTLVYRPVTLQELAAIIEQFEDLDGDMEST